MDKQNSNLPRIKINPFVVGGVVLGIVMVILLVISIQRIFRTNPFGPETKIDNFAEEYGGLTQNQRDMIFSQLYEMIYTNLPDDEKVPTSGAVVREGTAEYEYDKLNKVHHGSFIVDIPSIKRSYRVKFALSMNEENVGGYPVLITCLPDSLRIYGESSCNNLIETSLNWENDFQLDYTFGARTSIRIREAIDDFLLSSVKNADYYNVVIDGDTLRRDKTQPDFVFNFDIVLNQENRINILTRMDVLYGNEYIAVYIDDGKDKEGVIFTNSEESRSDLGNWLRVVSEDEQINIKVEELK